MKNVCVGNIGQIDFANTGQCPIIIARSPSGEAQLYLPQVTPRVPRSVHANRNKTVVRRGILRPIYRIQINSVDPTTKAISFIHFMSPVFNSTCVRN